MTEQKSPTEEMVVKQEGPGLLGSAAEATGKTFRFTLNVLSMPLMILPGQSRRHARKAMGEFAMSVMVLPKEFANSAERVVERLAGEEPGGSMAMPRAEEISDRARSFTNRMIRTAEEFTAGVVNASQKVGDAAEQTASKVDDWVQKKA
jgi:hypothetical protein